MPVARLCARGARAGATARSAGGRGRRARRGEGQARGGRGSRGEGGQDKIGCTGGGPDATQRPTQAPNAHRDPTPKIEAPRAATAASARGRIASGRPLARFCCRRAGARRPGAPNAHGTQRPTPGTQDCTQRPKTKVPERRPALGAGAAGPSTCSTQEIGSTGSILPAPEHPTPNATQRPRKPAHPTPKNKRLPIHFAPPAVSLGDSKEADCRVWGRPGEGSPPYGSGAPIAPGARRPSFRDPVDLWAAVRRTPR